VRDGELSRSASEAGFEQRKGPRQITARAFAENVNQMAFARLAMADFLLAAWLLWMTPLLAALSS
jgi:hypothetical protein